MAFRDILNGIKQGASDAITSVRKGREAAAREQAKRDVAAMNKKKEQPAQPAPPAQGKNVEQKTTEVMGSVAARNKAMKEAKDAAGY